MKILILSAVLFMFGCGDTVSQSASGHGTNIIAAKRSKLTADTESNEDAVSPASVQPSGNCPVTPPVIPGCSIESFNECRCIPGE